MVYLTSVNKDAWNLDEYVCEYEKSILIQVGILPLLEEVEFENCVWKVGMVFERHMHLKFLRSSLLV